jgi:hypothetical protein
VVARKKVLNNDWSNAALNNRKWGILGNVVAHHDFHGLYYDVLHVDGSNGFYDPSEIIVFSEQVNPKRKYENVITAEEARKITSESIIKSIDIQPYLNVIHYSIRNAAKDGKSFIRERMDKWAVLIPPSTESKIEICKVLIEEGYNIKSVAGLNQTNPEELGMYEDIEISW